MSLIKKMVQFVSLMQCSRFGVTQRQMNFLWNVLFFSQVYVTNIALSPDHFTLQTSVPSSRVLVCSATLKRQAEIMQMLN